MKGIRIRIFCTLFLASAFPSLAQITPSRLEGTFKDASGPMPGVTVTAVNTESGLSRSTVTGTDGLYSLILPPGPYTVTAGTAAHEEQKTTVRLQGGQTIDSSFDLKPRAMTTAAGSGPG